MKKRTLIKAMMKKRALIKVMWKHGQALSTDSMYGNDVWTWLRYAIRGTFAILFNRTFDEDAYTLDLEHGDEEDFQPPLIMAMLNYHTLVCSPEWYGHDWEELIVWGWRYTIMSNGDN